MGLFKSIGKFLTGGKKKSSKSKSSGTSDYDPWDVAIPYLTDYLKSSQALYTDPSKMFSPEEQQAIQMIKDTANAGSIAVDPAIAENNKVLSGHYLDPNTNPYIKDIADRMGGVAATNANAAFGGKGRTGSGLAGYYAGKGAADASGEVYFNNYNTERGRMGEAASRAPQLEAGRYIGPQALYSVGQNVSARPYDISAQHAGILQGIAGLGQQGKTTGEQTNYGYQQGLLGKIATSFTNKLFNLG